MKAASLANILISFTTAILVLAPRDSLLFFATAENVSPLRLVVTTDQQHHRIQNTPTRLLNVNCRRIKRKKRCRRAPECRWKKRMNRCVQGPIAVVDPVSPSPQPKASASVSPSSHTEDANSSEPVTICPCFNYQDHLGPAVEMIKSGQTERYSTQCSQVNGNRYISFNLPYQPSYESTIYGTDSYETSESNFMYSCYQYDAKWVNDEDEFNACSALLDEACAQLAN